MKPLSQLLLLISCFLWVPQIAINAQGNQTQPSSSTNSIPEMDFNSGSGKLFYCTTRITTKGPTGTCIATGFIFDYYVENAGDALFLVTCRHVFEGFDQADLTFVQSSSRTNYQPVLGQSINVTIPNLQSYVFYNPDPKIDVAIVPFLPVLKLMDNLGLIPYFKAIPNTMSPTKTQAVNLSSIQPIAFIGYPRGLHDEVNMLPIARRGYTASPFQVDFNGLPVYLIDASVFTGSSGSPVFVLDENGYNESSERFVAGRRTLFMGMISEAYFYTQEGQIVFKPKPAQFTPVVNTTLVANLGVVIKPKAIFNTVEKYFDKMGILHAEH